MENITVILTAIGLAMDAFAVSISCGFSCKKNTLHHALNVAIAFGAFQGGMTAFGWLVGLSFSGWIESVDHWIAFGLLGVIGAKMVCESFENNDEKIELTSVKVLITLAIATSIDALAVGISFSALKLSILFPVLMIAIITFVLSYFGVLLGKTIGSNTGFCRYINILGGIILAGIGLKNLLEHML